MLMRFGCLIDGEWSGREQTDCLREQVVVGGELEFKLDVQGMGRWRLTDGEWERSAEMEWSLVRRF